MTDRDDARPGSQSGEPPFDGPADAELTEALAQMGLLVPETPDEVAQMERELEATPVALPASLERFEPKRGAALRSGLHVVRGAEAPTESNGQRASSPVASLGSRRSHWLSGGLGVVLGAAATIVAWVATHEPGSPPTVGGVPSELRAPPKVNESRLKLDPGTPCAECCAGSECPKASPELTSCASGRHCVGCSPSDTKQVYQLRISAVGFSETGRGWALDRGPLDTLQICAEIQGRSLGCRAAVEQPTDLYEWTSLPVATTSSQLVGGLKLQLVAGGDPKTALASWSNSVTVSPETLCRGVSARLTNPEGEAVGRVSAFLDDPYFVELGRANNVEELLTLEARFDWTGRPSEARIYQTKDKSRGFALVLGPTDRKRAEALRWQLLDQGYDVPLTFGEDHSGSPRPARGR